MLPSQLLGALQIPSLVEGFLLRYRDWIQGDPVVRDVCHSHLRRLTHLRKLAPMQTLHCLKVLSGTCTPCPDYMFDHLRPAHFVSQQDGLTKKRGLCGAGRPPIAAPSASYMHAAEYFCESAVIVPCEDPQKRPLELPSPEVHAKHAKTGQEHGVSAPGQELDRENSRYHGSRDPSPPAHTLGDGRRLVPDVAACARTLKHHMSDHAHA